jgi:hypothetical protein
VGVEEVVRQFTCEGIHNVCNMYAMIDHSLLLNGLDCVGMIDEVVCVFWILGFVESFFPFLWGWVGWVFEQMT